MKTILLVALAVGWVVSAQTATTSGLWQEPPPQVHQRETTQNGKTYVVVYSVHLNAPSFVPATYPAGQPHYSADISIFEKRGDDLISIRKPSPGTWTPDGCSEDDPATLVKEALEPKKK